MSDHEEDLSGAPADLCHAGAVVDKAIEFMVGQNISSIAVASALLGGALGMLTRAMDDESIIRILQTAMISVQNGEFRAPPEGGDGHEGHNH